MAYGRGRYGRRRGRRAPARKRMGYRKRYPRHTNSPVFTEILEVSPIQTNTGGQFTCRFSDLPQASNYSVLYKQFAIKKLQVILLPNFGAVDPALVASGMNTSRFTFAINDTPSTLPPVSEIDVLASNGSKVVMGNKKIVITCRPKPDILNPTGKSAANFATRIRALTWLNTDSNQVGNSGTGIDHGSISWWCSNAPFSTQITQFSVYYKITFALRDPA